MKRRGFLAAVIALAAAGCQATPAIPDLSLYLKSEKVAVFVFLAPDCPLSQNYTRTLNELRSRFPRNSVVFYGVVPGDGFQQQDIDRFAQHYELTFPVLPDRNLELAGFFGAMKTPEAFVVTADGKTVYKGAIDNWAVEFGRQRMVITEHYLVDVVQSILDGRGIPYSEKTAAGCFIERLG